MKYRYLAFDVDGTLIDSERSDLLNLQSTLRDLMGQERPLEELSVVFGTVGKTGLAKLGYTEAEAERIYPVWYQRALDSLGAAPLFPGIESVLLALRARGCRMGVVTSRQRELYRLGAEPHALDRFFGAAICQEDTRAHKPEAEPMIELMRRLCAEPAQTLFVGDSRYDMECARAAGVDSALALWGAHDPGLSATHYLEAPEELLGLL